MLVGREREVAAVRGAIAEGTPIALVGDAGVGKTTIARAAIGDGLRETGALATLQWAPLFPFRRLIDRLRAADEATPEIVVRALLRDGTAPLLIDDLQWADDPSLEVVGLLAGRLPLVVTIRTGEPRSEEVAVLLELIGGERIDVSPLDDVAAAAVLDRAHPALGDDERAQTLQVAAGNPLLLHELPKADAASVSLVGVLVARVGELSQAARVAAERLAILGRPALDAELGPGAAQLVASGLASAAGGRTAFVHGLLGEVIAHDLGERAATVRRDLAGRVPGAEAAHLLEGAGDRAAARAAALAAAGATADRRLQAELLVLAVRCSDDLEVALRVRAARLLTETSQPERTRDLCEVPGLDHLPPVDRGGLLACIAEAAWMQGDQQACFELVERALADLRGSRTELEALALAGSTVVHTYVDLDGRPALARAEEAVALADELGVAQAYTRSRLASVRAMAGLDGAEELYLDAIERARADGDADVHRQAFVGMVLATWANGDVVRAAELARAEMASTRPDGFDVPWLGVAAYAALLAVLSGRPPVEVIDEFRPILEEEPSFRNRAFLEAAVVLALADAGRHAEAAGLAAGEPGRANLELQDRALALWAQAESAWLAGRVDAVEEVAAGLRELGIAHHPSAAMGLLIGAHAGRDRGEGPVGAAPTVGLPAWRGVAVEWRALQAVDGGDAAGAVRGFLEAAEAWESSDLRSHLRCRWAAGDVAIPLDPARARALLEDAERRALELGALAMANRVRRSLRALGVVRRLETDVGPAGLTEREAEVLEMVGSGMRTAAIGAALRIEPSTVDSLVRSAVRKLGAPTRVAAAAELARRRDGRS